MILIVIHIFVSTESFNTCLIQPKMDIYDEHYYIKLLEIIIRNLAFRKKKKLGLSKLNLNSGF